MIEFKLPSLGADMDEGKLLEWRIKPGDRVKRGDIVAVVDTSKAAVDIEIWDEGMVHELMVQPDATIPVGTVMAILLAPGEAAPARTENAAPAAPAAAATPQPDAPPVAEAPAPMVVAQASTYGSILPAAWSFMLAARARGLGTVWTTVHLFFEKDVATLLGIPDDWTQVAMFPVAFYTGDDFKPAHRLPSAQLTHWDSWGAHG